MGLVKANGIVLGYDDFGDAHAEPMLLISGLGAQRLRWAAPFWANLVARGFRVIRHDNRDAGDSRHLDQAPVPDFAELARAAAEGRKPDVPYTLHDMVDDAVGLLDALDIERAHVVGSSMGGMIAQLLAARYPRRVLSLATLMSSTGNPELPGAAPEVLALLTGPAPHPATDEAAYLAHRMAQARRLAGPAFPFDEDARRALLRDELRCAYDPAGTARQLAAIAATGDIRPWLARVRAPTLVVHGADDPLVPPACGEDSAASIPGATLMMIDGMGHDLPAPLYPVLADAIARNAGWRESRT
ncbi:alpha/beta fold hydrolase [Achromobacter aloeverae]|uniref:Alpha/beta hydrolase n=1 Tax=Achromobacter aloeverae TaxID=1750518 RepID=A0A4Q1HDA2_9BURK|nr:alpha/beta fold hydrolase [Achromobacter aloeverae]RXN82728.1 alpha/beta hydrolase [Achromobacter aloeverae]